MLEVRNAAKGRGRRTLWSGLSFEVAAGETVALTGPSGSGKSTLLDCLGLIDTLDSGVIRIADADPCRTKRDSRLARRNTLGYLFQDFGLVPDMSVEDNVRIAETGPRRRRSATRVSLSEALSRVGLAGKETYRAYELSGGEQQRVALARLLVKQPRLILADEPTSALDSENAEMVLEMLRGFAARGAAIVIATHSDAVRASADRELDLGTVGGGRRR